MSKRAQLILGTAGHIDHGKSSLVKALTGIDPDRLKEEKSRGITIELGFAQLQLPDGTTMGVIDVPGHERFVRQMISGSTGVDVALLCIAADDGIMPQTAEHLAVLQLLSVPSCVVALTKSDLAEDDWLALVADEIEAYLLPTPYAGAQIVPVSSRTGAGLGQLKDALLLAVRQHKALQRGSLMRLPIDRVFTIKGSGTVVTGTLWSGSVSPEDEVMVLPSERVARVRSVQVHDEPVEGADPGSRVAINLSGVTTMEVRPGDFLVERNAPVPTDRFDAHLTFLDTAKSGKPLKSGTRVRIAHGTKEVLGRILLIGAGWDKGDNWDKGGGTILSCDNSGTEGHRPVCSSTDTLSSGEQAFAQIRLEAPLPVSRGDHFIVRSYSPVSVIGGGRVLRRRPRRTTNLGEGELALLEALDLDDRPEIVNRAVSLEALPFTADDIAEQTEIDTASVQREIDRMLDAGALSRLELAQGAFCYTQPTALKDSLKRIEELLTAFHKESPKQPGISKTALLQRFSKHMDPLVFDALLRQAQKAGMAHVGEGAISHPKAGAHLKELDAQTGKVLLEILGKAASSPPLLPDLVKQSGADAGSVQRALTSLEKQGLVVRVNKDLYYEAAAFDCLFGKASALLQAQGRAQPSELKDAMGVSRKYAIPILEYLDSKNLTKRDGDSRTLGK